MAMSTASHLPDWFVCVGIQSWDLPIGSNAKDMARELANSSRVLYVNPPADRITRLKSGWPTRQYADGPAGHLRQISSSLWVLDPATTLESINWLPDSSLFDGLNRLNNQRFARCIRAAVGQLGIRSFTLLNDSDMFRSFYLDELLQPARYVYCTRDNLLAVPYWQRHGQRLEPALMRKADLVVSNSPYLMRVARQYNPNAVYIGQGCDLLQFNPDTPHPCPPDMQSIPRPRVGYVGTLSSIRLNLDWLVSLARQRPLWNLVLVGPEDDEFRQSELHALPNVYFLGAKPPADLPAYLQHIDVTINPQKPNELTIGNYPRKVDEYLAMGKPVVALRTETMRLFDPHVILADTLDEFMTGINHALCQSPEAAMAGIAFARQHTWATSVAALRQALLNTEPSTLKPA